MEKQKFEDFLKEIDKIACKYDLFVDYAKNIDPNEYTVIKLRRIQNGNT